MRKSVSILVLFTIPAVAVALYLYTTPFQWPMIEDDKQLISECSAKTLLPTSFIPESEWPESIRSLKPLSVLVGHNEFVEIVIANGGIGPRYSYFIFRTSSDASNFVAPDRKIRPTANPLIFQVH